MFAFFARLSFFLLVCRFFCFFARSVAVPSVVPNSQYAFNSAAPTRTAAVAVPVTTYAAAAVCTCDLQHSPPWLLLLSFIVNRLLIVYHAVLLLCHSYHPAHAFVWIDEHNIVHEVFLIHLWRPVPFLFCVSFFFISSDLAHRAPITTSVAVRLFAPDRDSCVLASCCGLPLILLQWRILHFSLRIRIVAAYFFI